MSIQGEKLTRRQSQNIEGTRESLERCANMLDEYAPDMFPASELGQIHMERSMMESVADEIRAFLKANPGETE